MHGSEIEVEGVGRLSHRGVSRHWNGEVTWHALGQPIGVSVDGTPDGPTPAQVTALREVLGLAPDEVFAVAATGLESLLAEAGLEHRPASEAFRIIGLDVPRESYDPAAVHVLVLLEHVDYPDDFLPAIDIVGGDVVEVLPGT